VTFEDEAFISYAHLDDQELIEGQKGWVTNFHRALQIRAGQLLGKDLSIWRDPKLQGNDVFADTLIDRLRRVAALISVLSPRYVKSEWTRRELSEFCKAAEQSEGIRIGDKARVFKILKTPVPLEMHPPELQPLLGYEFFKIDPETGRVRELDQMFGPEAQREFWLKVDDVAHDLCDLLLEIECPDDPPSGPGPEKAPVYLAETTRDVIEAYDAVRRDLKDHARAIVPPQTLPLLQSDLEAYVRAQLSQCCLSIHLIGKNYGIVPEEWKESLPEIQYRLAAERAAAGNFTRLIWIPPGLQVQDERQRNFLGRLRSDPGLQKGTDLLETPLEELRNTIYTRLKPASPKPAQSASRSQPSAPGVLQVYFIYDQRDAEATAPWESFLFKEGFEVLHPVFEGDEAEIREYHEDNLRTCDAVLIYYGAGSECWLRKKLREVQKIAGYGRTTPMRAVGIVLTPPDCPAKQNLRTHEAMVISQVDGFTPDPLGPFIQRTRTLIEQQAAG
jgi:hypothetical protein